MTLLGGIIFIVFVGLAGLLGYKIGYKNGKKAK